jgi:hypothetical protein
MIAGYTVAFIVMALYVASMYVSSRNQQQDKALLEDIQETAPPVQMAAKPETRKRASNSAPNGTGKPVTKKSRKK